MDVEVDHCVILGLPSGEEGAKLSADDIRKGYRSKALEKHPDKRPGINKPLLISRGFSHRMRFSRMRKQETV